MSNDYRNEIIGKIERSLSTILDSKQNRQVMSRIICILDDYEVTERHTEITVYDDSNDRLLMQYAACLAVEGKSKRTIKTYGYLLKRFFAHTGKSAKETGRYDVRSFLAHEKTRGLSDTTIRNEQAYVSAFFKWAVAEEIIDRNPCDAVKSVKCADVTRTPFSATELDALRSACQDVKERALIELMVSSGVRVSELVNLNVSDINFSDLTVHVRNGKGGKNRVTHMTAVARMHLQKYLLSRDDDSEVLIRSRTGRYSSNGIWKVLQRIGERAKVADVYPHRFRHTFASNLASRGMPIQKIQILLGHSGIGTTMKYVHTDERQIKSSYEQFIA